MWLKTNPPFSTNRQQSLINSDKLESISVRAPSRDTAAWTVRGDLPGSQGSCILYHGSEQECNDFIFGLVDDLDIAAAIPAELLRIAQVLSRIADSFGTSQPVEREPTRVYTNYQDDDDLDSTDIPEGSWQDDVLKAIGD